MKDIFLFFFLISFLFTKAQDDGAHQTEDWPTPQFNFKVEFGASGPEATFQEISGIDTEAQVIEYRHGADETYYPDKMPGLKKTGNVTLKKGIFRNDNQFYDWYQSIKMNTIKRETVTITLLDEEGGPLMVWALLNAWPTKITGTDLNSDGNEIAIEFIELGHEGLTIDPK